MCEFNESEPDSASKRHSQVVKLPKMSEICHCR